MNTLIKLTVEYDLQIQKITGKERETLFVGGGATFAWVFEVIYSTYPEIFNKYYPGEIGFLLEGKSIDQIEIVLMDGDTITFYVIPGSCL